jgi:hypothetical protein
MESILMDQPSFEIFFGSSENNLFGINYLGMLGPKTRHKLMDGDPSMGKRHFVGDPAKETEWEERYSAIKFECDPDIR